ncbi:SCO family protein [Niveibacterium microcysteis]|uniref:SCO family protein n=1 Tax=Niveibacterium microcysteis TaxID=2811415 RepID=A0ABX7M7B1_9RHOO|nr:SCO family protein [Niveibacterium microcysteis]QSI77618.1 SCO family protein [Niveibacterium microcysteis]
MRRRFLAVLAAALLGGCGVSDAPKFHATDITGADYAKAFTLTDQHGKPRTLAEFKGKAVTVFFGYTQCPDVCPTNLSTMAQVVKLLGADGERLQVVFVTVDPERDTQQLLSEYMPAFHPTFLGLRGDAATTERVMKDFRIFAQKQGDIAGGNYTVDHTAGTYAYDPQGRLRLYIRHGETPQNIADDLRLLIAGK